MKDASDLHGLALDWLQSLHLPCTGEPRAGPSSAGVASQALNRVGREAAGAREAVFDLGMAKDVLRTLHGQQEPCAVSDPEEWEVVRAGSSPSFASARAWCPQKKSGHGFQGKPGEKSCIDRGKLGGAGVYRANAF